MFRRGMLFAALAALLLPLGSAYATVHHIDVGDLFFSPAGTVVQPGDTVRWTMVSGFAHTSTSDGSSPKSWASPALAVGDSFQIVIEVADGAGPFPYHCAIHPLSMKDTLFVAPPAPEPQVFAFLLDPDQANDCAGTGSAARGFGVAVLSADSSQLSLYVEHDVASPTMAHVHLGAPCVSGGVAFGFGSPASPINETWALTPTDVANLFAGDLYVNIHSGSFPGGEIRGQIVQDPIEFVFTLDEAQANAGSGTASHHAGYAIGELRNAATEFAIDVTHDIPADSAIDAHIHLAPPNTNGSVVFGLNSPDSPISDTWAIDTLSLRDLLRGDLYVNVHTSAFPGGEIRGQIVREPIRWAFRLNGSEAGTGSSATGFAVLELNADMNELSIHVEHDVVDVLDGHIHLGPIGVDGSVVYGFSSVTSPIDETWALTKTDITRLLTDSLYVNIHSNAFPAGEIRGQIDQDPIMLNVAMDESQASACAGTGSAAVGQVAVALKDGGREMTLAGTHDVASPIDAHVHLGGLCVNGGVAFGFSSPASPIHEQWYLTRADVINYLKGDLYVNIHSTPFPGGEIRGQLAPPAGCCTLRGDLDGSAALNVSDLTYLVAFLFQGGPGPACEDHGDIDSSGSTNVSDLTYLVSFLFQGGPAPGACP